MEKLQFIRVDANDGGRMEVVVQLTDGGAGVTMHAGAHADKVIVQLRDLANMIERGLASRAATQSRKTTPHLMLVGDHDMRQQLVDDAKAGN